MIKVRWLFHLTRQFSAIRSIFTALQINRIFTSIVQLYKKIIHGKGFPFFSSINSDFDNLIAQCFFRNCLNNEHFLFQTFFMVVLKKLDTPRIIPLNRCERNEGVRIRILTPLCGNIEKSEENSKIRIDPE